MTNLFRYKGTVLVGLWKRPIVILSVLMYVGTSICKHGYDEQCGQHLPIISLSDLSTAGTLVTFFLSFYATSCYGRFLDQYTHLKDIEGIARAIAVKVHVLPLPAEEGVFDLDPDIVKFRTIELFRYLGASYYLLFARLYNGDAKEFNLQTAHEEGLITVQEMAQLEDSSPGMRWFRMLCWAFQIVREMEHSSEGHVPESNEESFGEQIGGIEDSILEMRSAMNAVTYQAQMPVPFSYYHIITVLTFGFIVPYSYACGFLATTSPCLAWIVYTVPVFGFAGMREVAMDMADPFGDDDTDLPVDVYVHNLMTFLVGFVEEKMRPRVIHGRTFHQGCEWGVKFAEDDVLKQTISTRLETGTMQEAEQDDKDVLPVAKTTPKKAPAKGSKTPKGSPKVSPKATPKSSPKPKATPRSAKTPTRKNNPPVSDSDSESGED